MSDAGAPWPPSGSPPSPNGAWPRPGAPPPPPPPPTPPPWTSRPTTGWTPPTPSPWSAQRPPPSTGWTGPPPAAALPPPGAQRAASLVGLATALTRMLPLVALTSVGSTVALVQRAALLDDPSAASFEDAAGADDLVNGIGALGGLLLIATAVVWIVWQYRHATNAARLDRATMAPGWAIGGWFVPLANLVLPQLALVRAARAGGGRAPTVMAGWWATSAAAAVLVVTGTALRPVDDDIGDLAAFQFADRVAAAGAATSVAAAVLAIVVVRRLTADQDASRPPAPPPVVPGAWSPQGYGVARPGPGYGTAPPYQPPPPGYPGRPTSFARRSSAPGVARWRPTGA